MTFYNPPHPHTLHTAMSLPRLAPGIVPALMAWMLYGLITFVIQSSSGISYLDWFKTAANAWRTGVLSLAVGSVVLLGWLAITRWDHLWRDPRRLPVTGVMKAAMGFWWAAIALRLAGVDWQAVPLDLLLAVVVSGVLVGFAEETLFRGFVLRALREGGRAESSAALWTAVCFGLFHLPNVLMGTGAVGVIQVFLAALSGSVLYVFRRHTGRLWPAMVAHGAWDISAFLAGGYALPWLNALTLPMLGLSVLVGIVVLASIVRGDRHVVMLP